MTKWMMLQNNAVSTARITTAATMNNMKRAMYSGYAGPGEASLAR